ncbi:MAG: dihydropteroate synthase [Actinobacteria bacterium]|uniref:dihydropteroate synthase n=1 Tax=freshwater metagenome TaxID=449393 RepID=A0A6J6S4Y9_9ZZZZ|nr:dihydropteroate synthase [Actinomycetota bacterium]MSX71765.1 dihydropteroate synthase [Actinomycetota bacterium]MSY69668.1 dihydropteroate synthase [Actinomycetota bacterium]MTA75940.1 dihydropteroate synthase [Actinomycetota bacterium]
MIVMGILNVTPDSFADGGRHNDFEAAVHRAHEMLAEGVDIIDIGGESTKPGAERVSEAEEFGRVIPVIKELAKSGVRISIDTMRASTAKAAIEAGAQIINDVSGGLADPGMLTTAAQLQAPYIAMHWRGHSKDMNSLAVYDDVVKDVISELQERISAALDAGITKDKLIIDPGLGFAKDAQHNWDIIDSIDQFVAMGYPVLIGASRKRFLGGDNPDEREAATIRLTKRLSTSGIWGVRVHSVKSHKDALKV